MNLSKEHIKFLIFLTIAIILTSFLMDIISRSWHTELMKTISGAIKFIYPDGVSALINIAIGFYVGSLLLLFLDRYKRIQAIIISIGIFIITNYISKNFDVNWNILYIGLGALIGVVLGSNLGKDFKKIGRKEFGNAARNVSMISIFYIIVAFLVIHIISEDIGSFVIDAIVVLSFSYFFGEVMNYRTQGPKIFVLGPAASGKTLFLAGCYMRMLDIAEIPVRASNDLLDLTDELHKVTWPSRTGGISKYQFTFEVGKIFPRETTLRTIDYPGVYLEDILSYMYSKKDIKKMDDVEKKYVMAAKEVINADKLIFIVDGAKYPRFEDMGIIHYTKIVTRLHENGKYIKPYIVVTKSDLFKEEYPDFESNYDGFRKFIEEKFSQNIYIRQLLIESQSTTFYPVFYHTKKIDDEYIPLRDDNRNVYIFGFDKFMDSLVED